MENIQSCKPEDIFNISGELDAETRTLIMDYLCKFATRGKEELKCLRCGSQQEGVRVVLLGGGFTWGLAHGEGHCSKCGWPARMYHEIRNPEGELVAGFTLLLQYHPTEVKNL